jgi:hypothetical protein
MAKPGTELTLDFFVRELLVIVGFHFGEIGRNVKGVEVCT